MGLNLSLLGGFPENVLNTAVVHHTQRSKTLEQGMITAVFNTFSSGPKKNMLNTAVCIQPEEEREQ
jgi:hypothetical protein